MIRYGRQTALGGMILLSLTFCSSQGKNELRSNAFLLAGRDLSDHDRAGGVTQASPGIQETPSEDALLEVKPDESLLRFKMFDDPVPEATTNGLLQFVVEYDDARSFITQAGYRLNGEIPDLLELTVEKIELRRKNVSEPEKDHRFRHRNPPEVITIRPTGKDALVLVKEGRHFIAIIRGLSLPGGVYRDLNVKFKSLGKLIDADEENVLVVAPQTVSYSGEFQISAGRITTLHAVPLREYIEGRGRSHDWHSPRVARIRNPERRCHHGARTYYAFLIFKATGQTQHIPADRVFVKMTELLAAGASSEILNDRPTEIELLSLRNGAVALMGHNTVPPGMYQYFQMNLSGKGRVEWGDAKADLTIESDANSIMRFMGPFDLRGGRITEVFLHFDPNTSIFFTQERGWILDPDVTTTSVTSMTPQQDRRLIQALGVRSNIVASEADIIIQAQVLTKTEGIGQNREGKNLIYSNLILKVTDRLRGQVDNPDQFPLRVVGGSYGGVQLRVRGMPEFSQNENVLLFLQKTGDDSFLITRGESGKISI